MGILNRMTRESLEKLNKEEFEAFLDDVSDFGFTKACADRVWTQRSTLNWLKDKDHPERWEKYDEALKTKAEALMHGSLDLVIGKRDQNGRPERLDKDDVPGLKLQSDAFVRAARVFDRDRYGEKIDVKHGGAVGGLTIVLAQLPPAEQEKVLSPERVVATQVAQEADAGETVPEPLLDGRVSSTGVLPPEESPRLSVIHPTSYGPI